MSALLPWLPTIVAVITAAVALGGSRTKLDTIEALLREVRSEGKELLRQVGDALKGVAVHDERMEAHEARIRALEAALIRETDLRHKDKDAFNAALAHLEARIDARPHP